MPAALDPDGNLIGPFIAPALCVPSEAELNWDRAKDCD